MDDRRSLRAGWLPGLGLGVAMLVGAGVFLPAPTAPASEVDPLAGLLLPWWLLGVACLLGGTVLQSLSGLPPSRVPVSGAAADDLTIPLLVWAIPPDPLDDLTIPYACTP